MKQDHTSRLENSLQLDTTPPHPPTILVVEDNIALNQLLSDLLTTEGYRVVRAHHGVEALEALRVHSPDLVLSDVVMPHMDGYTLLSKIRDDPRFLHLPVILLTGYGSAEDHRRALEWGVEGYLSKPLDDRNVLETVRHALRRRMMTESAIRRRVDNVRNQILGLIQHEFRTPLTLIMGYAEFIQDSLVDEANHHELRQSVNAILEGSRRLHHLVESFLLLAHLSRETLPEDEIFPLDPTALWRECLANLRESLNSTSLQVRIVEPQDPVIVYGVMELLREALTRLLDNAIRYRRPESRWVELSTSVKPGYVGWTIRDEGIGIPLELLAQITDPFVRSQPTSSAGRGAGLSLTLARRIAELHGGHLQVESRPGEGSTFTLWVADRDV